jgi:predicted RNase H-like HicB family nuclease
MEDGDWFGAIPGFVGLWATGATQEACWVELRSTLEDWLLMALRHNEAVPVVDGIDLAVLKVA